MVSHVRQGAMSQQTLRDSRRADPINQYINKARNDKISDFNRGHCAVKTDCSFESE